METRSANQVNEIRATFQFCTSNATSTSSILAFAGVLATVGNKLILIDSYDIIAEATTKGITLDTKEVRSVMEFFAYKCLNAVIAFASPAPANKTLIALVKYSKTQLREAKKEDIAAICETIRKAAHDNSGCLSNGITVSDITDLASAISLYNTASSNPRQAIIEKSYAKEQIKVLTKEIQQDLFKNQMDTMVNTLIGSNDAFVEKYYKVRKIVNLGISHTKFKGTVTKTDKTPIPVAILKIMATGKQEIDYTIEADVNGVFPNTYIKPTDYDMQIECPGYITQNEIKIHFTAGKALKRSYILIPTPPPIPTPPTE
ncbi:MAG: hypothetical protein WCH34_00355 [Bacteroidota bacterium]